MYLKQIWRNARAANPTPLVASRFNHMENGIEAAHILYEAVKHGFRIVGMIDDQEFLPESAEVGDSYIVDKKLFFWDGREWIDGGYIRGPQGPRGEPGTEHPIGSVILFAGDMPPDGWLLCDGSMAPKTKYPVLASIVGEIHGSSSDPNSFRLPDMPAYHNVNFIIKT